jgi:CHAT domain-containing protein
LPITGFILYSIRIISFNTLQILHSHSRHFLLALILTISGVAGWAYVHGFHSLRQELLEMLKTTRPVEARLVGADFTPYQPGAGFLLESLTDNRTARQIEVVARRRSSSRALGNLAILKLFLGRSNEAVAVLERAVAAAPKDALLLNDLAVAYVDRADDGRQPFDYIRALSATDRARRADPDLREPLFNRALVLERLGLPEAKRAWADFAAIEEDFGWRAEAESHLHKLNELSGLQTWNSERERLERAAFQGQTAAVEAIVSRFPQPARIYAEEVLLARWAEKACAGDHDEATADLITARAIGAALLRRGGDSMVHDTVAALDEAMAEPSGERLSHLREGHRLFGPGLRSYRSNNYRKAALELKQAEWKLRLGRSAFAHWALVYLASCEYFNDSFESTRRRLEDLQRVLPPGRYPALMGQTAWILGSIDLLRGRPGEALPQFQQGREIFARLGEIDRLSGIYHQIALTLGSLGQREDAWAYLFEGLRVLSQLQTPRTVAGLLDEAGIICIEVGHPDVALYFQDELLSHALGRGDPGVIVAARLLRAKTMLRLGLATEAEVEVAAALRQAQNISEEKPRRRMQAETLTARAEIYLHSHPRLTDRDLTLAIGHFEASGYHLQLPLAYFLRARARLAVQRVGHAGQDFEAGLREIERTRGSVREPRLRIAFQDQAVAFFDEVLTFLADRNDGPQAFVISERGRARQLLESLAVASLSGDAELPRSNSLLTAREVKLALPPRTALIKYAVLQDRLLVWAFGPGGEEFHQYSVTQAELERLITRVRTALRAGGNGREVHDLQDLYRQLIGPAAGVLAGAHALVLVPDREIHLLPFAALVDPRSGRYLVEDYAVAVAPSANVYVRSLQRSREGAVRPPQTILAVGATSFDRPQFPSLAPLPHAEREAALVAATYPEASLMVGDGATKSRFFAELARKPEVIHFAGHAIPNFDFPELSLLLFAPEPGNSDSGAVYSYEVQAIRLDRTRLVVLSACNTAAFGEPDSEGAVGLAQPFLVAGVLSVLASLAPVEDERSRELLTRFHLHLRGGDSPAEALRAAQIHQIVSGGEAALPAHWAMYEIIGGAPLQPEKEDKI